MALDSVARDVLDFWFGPRPHALRDEWFRKDAAFDATIRARFGDAIASARAARSATGVTTRKARSRG